MPEKRGKRVLLIKVDKPAGGDQRLSASEPIGICYLASWLRANGIDCRLLHCLTAEAEEMVRCQIQDYRPNVVGFSVRNFNLSPSAECLKMIKREFPGCKTVVGGEIVVLQLLDILASYIQPDAFIFGSGENTLLHYARTFDAKPLASPIPGLALRDADGGYRSPERLAEEVNPGDLPMMIRDGLPMESYSSLALPKMNYATMHTQRGCRFRCSFCCTAATHKGNIRARGVRQVLDEIKVLTGLYSVKSLAIWDEDFFSDPERVKGIAEGMIQNGFGLEWHTYMRLQDLENQKIVGLLPLLRRSGYKRAVIGLESFDPQTLYTFNKYGNENIETLAGHLTANGISLCPSYIIGSPHETAESIKAGLNRLLDLRKTIRMDFPYISFLTPFPGTSQYDTLVEKNLIAEADWSLYDSEHVVVQSKCGTDDLYRLRDEFYREFYGDTGNYGGIDEAETKTILGAPEGPRKRSSQTGQSTER